MEPGAEAVGHITVSVKGHTVDRMLAMAYLDTTHSWPGNRLVVQINGQPRQATVTTTPFSTPTARG